MSALAGWPALVLCAGLATRLEPLSRVRAKAALPVAGAPLVRRLLAWLAAAGVRRVVINLHHRPDTITRVVGDGSDLQLEVRYSWEPVLLGSAGGPSRARPLLDADRFLVVNGDTITSLDLADLVRAHGATGAKVTMACVPGDLSKYNALVADDDGRVTGIARRAPALPTA
ncbi:MAG: nucleotidyltransferase family protein, partial [Acidobacteriota bacterium]